MTELFEQLCLVVAAGDFNEAARLLNQEDEPDARTRNTREQFSWMAAGGAGNFAVVEWLVETRAQKARLGRSALFEAVKAGHTELVAYLLATSEDCYVDCKNTTILDTALVCATLKGHVDTIEYLVWRGASVGVVDRSGRTALMYAIEYAQTGVVDYLIAAGANVNAHDEFQWTALMKAAAGRNLPLVERLVEAGADMHMRDTDGNTALTIAEGHPSNVSEYLHKMIAKRSAGAN